MCHTLPLPMLITHLSGEPWGCVGIKSPLSKSSSCTFSSNERKLENITPSRAAFGVRTAAGKYYSPDEDVLNQSGLQHLFLLHSEPLEEETPSKRLVWHQKTLPHFLKCSTVTSSCCTPHASRKVIKYSDCCQCNPRHRTTAI